MPSAAVLRVLEERDLVPLPPRPAGPPRHQLSDRDIQSRTATCSICGPVAMAKNGTSWMCAVKKADLRASWYNRHGRKSEPSKHALTWRDVELQIGLCPIDGQVQIVPFARGWACKVRATELGGWRREPAKKCGMCGNYDSRHNPVSPTELQDMCAQCRRLTHQGPTPREQAEATEVGVAFGRSPEEFGNIGAHFVREFDWMNPEFMPDYESAVPGWKTLGAPQ